MTSRKKVVGDSSGKLIDQKRRQGRAPSIAAASISDFGMLQPGEEEEEVVRDLLPHRGHHDQRHRVPAVEQAVPVKPIACSQYDAMPMLGENMKSQSTPATAGATA